MPYRVIVGNIGTVLETSRLSAAEDVYKDYIELSRNNYGRAAGEAVTLLEDDEPIKEHHGYQHMFEDYSLNELVPILSARRAQVKTVCPICTGDTPPVNGKPEFVPYDDGKDERVHLMRKCSKCGFTFMDILRVTGIQLVGGV